MWKTTLLSCSLFYAVFLAAALATAQDPCESLEVPDPLPPLSGSFKLTGARGVPGGSVTLPFSILASAPVQGYSFSIDFDEEVLRATEVEVLYERPDGGEYGFKVLSFSNENASPGNGGVDEGWVAGAVVFDLQDNCSAIPANSETRALALHFEILPETDATTTEVRFLEGVKLGGPDKAGVPQVITAYQRAVELELEPSFVFINGLVDVLPDITIFIRGDSNGDLQVDLSDTLSTLGWLFSGATVVDCKDANDANDDGQVDVTDPIYTLNHLFRGGPQPPPPYPTEGGDPTEDAIDCSRTR